MTHTTPNRVRRRAAAAALLLLLAWALLLPGAASAAAPLAPGDEGPRVAALQRAFGVEVDGIFGEALRVAVTRLQRANGLAADGSVGPATWGLLERIRARARKRAAVRPSRPQPGVPAARRARAPSVGWGGALLTSLRLSSSRALGGRVPRERARMTRTAKPAARAPRTSRSVARKTPRATALDGPRLRMGAAKDYVRRKRRVSPPLLPLRVRRVIAAGDRIATMPYRYGGGHGNWNDSGYDCSGSVSYALHGAGLLDVALASGGLMSWGEPGPGRWITVYANAGHVFMVVAGRRFDTSGRNQTGSRWQPATRGAAGYVARHPAGL